MIAGVSPQPMAGVDAMIAAIVGAPKIPIFPDSFPAQVDHAYVAARYCGSTSALALIQDAAEKQHHLAEACLSALYWQGDAGLTKDAEQAQLYANRALPWLQTETARGNMYAQHQLGDCYGDGRGVAKNLEKAVRLFTLAADQGLASAQLSLGKHSVEL
jgi:TPR repeat protein